MRWIQNPQAVVPGNAMPNKGVSEQEARDMAAYLYRQLSINDIIIVRRAGIIGQG